MRLMTRLSFPRILKLSYLEWFESIILLTRYPWTSLGFGTVVLADSAAPPRELGPSWSWYANIYAEFEPLLRIAPHPPTCECVSTASRIAGLMPFFSWTNSSISASSIANVLLSTIRTLQPYAVSSSKAALAITSGSSTLKENRSIYQIGLYCRSTRHMHSITILLLAVELLSAGCCLQAILRPTSL